MYEVLGYKPEIEQIAFNSPTGKFSKIKDQTVYLTRGEVAKQLQISLPTLHSYVKQGFIKSFRIGGKVRFKLQDIEQALTERNFISVKRKGGQNAA
jgi:excisionase family DNA binding protein